MAYVTIVFYDALRNKDDWETVSDDLKQRGSKFLSEHVLDTNEFMKTIVYSTPAIDMNRKKERRYHPTPIQIYKITTNMYAFVRQKGIL